MKDELIIRSYEDGDKEVVTDLWHACGLVVPWNHPERDIARKVCVDRELFLVGEVQGKIVATVMGGYEGHRGWINYLAVAPELQRCGYGRDIMTEVEKRLHLRGCPKINLQVRTGNTAVLSFYASIGFKKDDVVSLGKRLVSD